MMSSDSSSKSHTQSWEGQSLHPSGEKELQDAIVHAFDYRGDVTIHLKEESRVVGYLFDYQETSPQPYVKIFLEHQNEPRTILYTDIVGIEFSGEDTAFGRSWDDWAEKWKKPQPG